MSTRFKAYPDNSNATIPRRSNGRRVPNIVEPEIRTIEEVVPMADRTMEELLQAPTEGDVPNDAIKLMLFSYSLEGAARIWYEKEPPNSILTLDDLVNKFVNRFFPPSKTTHLKNEISRFTQRFEETFGEAWERFKEMLRACSHHGFSELTQIDTFYNGLNEQDQDSLNAAAGGNLLSKTTREALKTNQKFVIQEANRMFLGNQPSVCAETGTYNQVSPPNRASNQIPPPGFAQVQNNQHRYNQNQGQGTLLSNTVPNLKGEMKVVTTHSGLAYEGPSIPTNSPPEKNKYHLEVLESEEILQYDQSFELFSLDQTTWICLSKEVVQLR
nr:reverse transcriptase domain-containing protein [Tanacetum cinerariifolium]